ncbi:MAG: tetratricopeptide repeat protein, partial [Flavobacteriales bacterium]|nr:tetratricopeptide repeat protein [Flavobacteriales bacterium]
LAMREAAQDSVGMATSYNNMGMVLDDLGRSLEAMTCYQKSMRIRQLLGDRGGVASVSNNMAAMMTEQGKLDSAILYLSQGLTVFEEVGDRRGMANALNNIGKVHYDLGEPEVAIGFLKQSLEVAEALKDKFQMAAALNNMASAYHQIGMPDSVLAYQRRSLSLKREIGNQVELATSLGNLGEFFLEQGDLQEADRYFEEALIEALRSESPDAIADAKSELALLRFRQGEHRAARDLAEEELGLIPSAGDLRVQRDAHEVLYRAYRALGQNSASLVHLEQFMALRDSLVNETNTREVIRQGYQYAYDKQALADSLHHVAEIAVKGEELRRERVVRNGFMGGFALVALFAGIFLVQRNRIGKEKARSEELLLNILPEEVAEELKDQGRANARRIDQATVLFTDFKGFTALSEKVTPKQLVKDLHECFSAFDRICVKHGLEKIKTIGDAYMAAGGLPVPNATHARDAIAAAFEMRDFIAEGKARKIAAGLPYFEIRIGIHTGPVVAGIVGVKKFSYDIWG